MARVHSVPVVHQLTVGVFLDFQLFSLNIAHTPGFCIIWSIDEDTDTGPGMGLCGRCLLSHSEGLRGFAWSMEPGGAGRAGGEV